MAGVPFSFDSGLNESIFGKSLAPIRSIIQKRHQAHESNSLVKVLFDVYDTDNWGDKFTSMTSMRGFVPGGENAAFPQDHIQESYSKTVEYIEWRDGFTITRKAADDTKNMDAKKKPVQFMQAYAETREMYAAATFGAAISGKTTHNFRGTNFNVTGADGCTLFSKEHPSILDKKFKQCNMFADEFSEDALYAAETAMQQFCGDNGDILALSPDTIVIPNDYRLKKAVIQVVGSDKTPETSNNGWNLHYGRWNIVVNPYLNQFIAQGTSPWMLMDSKANKEIGGAVWGERVPLEIDAYIDKGTKGLRFDGYARFGAAFVDWRVFCVGGVSGGNWLLGGE